MAIPSLTMALSRYTAVLLLFFVEYYIGHTTAHKMELDLQLIEQVGECPMLNITNIRVKKYNHTVAVLNGTAQLFEDLDDRFSFRVAAAYSTLGNNQFNEYPMKIPEKTVCAVMRENYREYQHIWANYTNMPHVGADDLCPFPKGKYWVRNFAPDPSWIPPVVPQGYWRLTYDLLSEAGVIQCRLRAYMRVQRSWA
ncbi:uncharacterized protein LOC129719607 [Wyeomyia smithii]|uniref:uncharacterized protein LOC129719607 n=1 Tax=Wyeomyia smithii TaxID=174621 RepID=UPI002467B47B|nr:uncharacterized protein LOC129719607 [Wyeomyia smithii]